MEVSKTQQKANINTLLTQAYEVRATDLEKSIKLAEDALELSNKHELDLQRGRALAALSLFHMITGDFDLAKNMANEAIELLEVANDRKGIADAKYAIAGALYKTDDFHEGLKLLLECFVIYKSLDDLHNQSRVQKSIGTIYENFGDLESAMNAYQQAITFGEKVEDLRLQSNAFNPLAGIFLKLGRKKEAKQLIDKSIEYKNQTEDIRGLAFALYARGKYHIQSGDLDLAEKDFQDALDIHERVHEMVGSAMCYQKQGLLYFKMGKIDFAKECLVKALSYSNKHNIVMVKYKANELLHQIARKEKDYELALKYLQQYISEKERVINTQTAKVIQSYETIHEMASLEQEALRQKERAELYEQKKVELDSFFYRISHDLKGPITSMMSLAYVAKMDIKDEIGRKHIDHFETMAGRLNTILDGLLTLTKTSYDKVHQEAVDFKQVVTDCIDSYQFLENYDKINFESSVDEGIDYVGDWSLVNTIIQNLVENGIKYARLEDNDPRIKISISKINDHIKIRVGDNGVGMDQETADNVFHMFYRVNRKIKGTGLGLHILKRAVERLQGEVSVTSKLGEGSEFVVTLPV